MAVRGLKEMQMKMTIYPGIPANLLGYHLHILSKHLLLLLSPQHRQQLKFLKCPKHRLY